MTQAGSMPNSQSELADHQQQLNQMNQEDRVREHEWIAGNPKKAMSLQSAALATKVMEGDDPLFFEKLVPGDAIAARPAHDHCDPDQAQQPIHLGYLGWKLLFAGAGALLFVLYSILMAAAL